MTTSSTTTDNSDLERAFSHIQQGNDLEAEGSLWKAAREFDSAQEILGKLLAHHAADADADKPKNDDTGDEQRKILQLYQQQAREYFIQARENLCKAMKEEHEKDRDEKSSGAEPSCRSLSEEDAQDRLRLFGRLFAREDIGLLKSSSSSEKDVVEKQSSLEERLMQLNESLPSGFKTSEERMRDINRGLNRLGLSLYPTAASDDRPKTMFGENVKSETEQVDDIIAQARDEVAVLGGGEEEGQPAPSSSHAAPDVGLDDADDFLLDQEELFSNDEDDEENSTASEMDTELIESIREKCIDAQAHLAELISLLDVDEEGDAEIEFDQTSGKQALRKARTLLLEAAKEWKGKSTTTTKQDAG